MFTLKRKKLALDIASNFIAGASLTLAFSPFDYWFISFLSLAYFFHTVFHNEPQRAALLGYAYGFGLFGVGVNWLHISINLFGGVNLAGAFFLTYLLVAFLSLYPALVAYLYRRFFSKNTHMTLIVVLPVLWVLSEWFRSWIFTGFPWLNIGYSQIDTPLASLAPLLGVYGVSWLCAIISALLLVFILSTKKIKMLILITLFASTLILYKLTGVAWTDENDRQLNVALLQGAIPQEIKWKPDQRQATLDLYQSLSQQATDSDLIIWPETAIPLYHHQAANILQEIENSAKEIGTDFLIGIPFKDPDTGKYYNGIRVVGETRDTYYKQHLVPFGEYLPFDKWLRPILNKLNIPMSDFSAGPDRQPVVNAANEIIGVSICYEDVFGEEVIKALPEASILVNISNDAWFGDSIAPHQHLQMARMRALETGRYLLRATNTGVSAIIDEKGKITSQSPQFVPHVTSQTVKTFSGATPYVKYGNWLVIVILFLILIIYSLRSRSPGRY